MSGEDKSPPRRFPEVPRLLGVLMALAGRRVAFIHTEPGWRRWLRTGEAAFPLELAEMLVARGYAICFLPYGRAPYPRRLWGRTLHFYLGPGRGRQGAGCWVLHPGYVDGYWYLDPLGHRERSSIGALPYDPASVDAAPANALFGHVRRASVRGGWSTRAQPERSGVDLPEGAIVLTLQRFTDGKLPPGAICSEIEMIRSVAAARDARPVLIKYHPFGVDPETRAEVETLCAGDPGVRRVEANIHDLLQVASVLCCFSSGTGFEAMLHRVPTVLFADADFHHLATRVTALEEVPAALQRALSQRVNYPKYVHWFLTRNLWHAEHPDLGARLDALIAAGS